MFYQTALYEHSTVITPFFLWYVIITSRAPIQYKDGILPV